MYCISVLRKILHYRELNSSSGYSFFQIPFLDTQPIDRRTAPSKSLAAKKVTFSSYDFHIFCYLSKH